MINDRRHARRHAGAVSWPQLLAVIGVLLLAFWLYRRHLIEKNYGPAVIAQSIATARLGQTQVEEVVSNYGVLPRHANETAFMPVDQTTGSPDRLVRLRVEMLDEGEMVVHYDGWEFHDASLRLVPKLGKDSMNWKCLPAGIPSDWINDWCTLVEKRVIRVAVEDPKVAVEAEAARAATTARLIAEAPKFDLWDPPFHSRGPLNGDAVQIADALRQLEPFQDAALEYYSIHKELPSSGAELESKFTPEQRQLKVGSNHKASVSFGPTGDLYVEFEGFGSDSFSLMMSPSIAETNMLQWQCTPSGDHEGVDLPPECHSLQ